MDTTIYAIGLGSNRRGRHGSPEREVAAAIDALGGVIAMSRIIASKPMGPSIRRFANAVVLIESEETPRDLLTRLKTIEHDFGRRRGQRWGARVVDLDIVLWSGGVWADEVLVIPHPEFRSRRFVLGPLVALAPDWRDPITGRTIRQLAHTVDRRTPHQ